MSLSYQIFGETAILISWENKISKAVHAEVMQMERFISEMYQDVIIECVPSYQSLTVYLHSEINPTQFIAKVEKNFPKYATIKTATEKNIITVPVCYDEPFSLDLERVAAKASLTMKEVVERHTQPLYPVYFIGFLPGFPYLGGLDEKLITPRLESPRASVPSGSVGIGGAQTGIYTNASPGGWNLIGRSPLMFFSIHETPPSLLRAGDFVKFRAISIKEYDRMESLLKNGLYQIEREVIYD